jgi:hypothetical protein
MKSKSMASKQYTANQFGMTSGPKRPKKTKSGDQEVSMECSKDGCGTFNSGGRSRVGEKTNRQNKGGAKGLSSKPQYASKVMSKKEADKRAVKFAENRAKAAQPKKMKAKF